MISNKFPTSETLIQKMKAKQITNVLNISKQKMLSFLESKLGILVPVSLSPEMGFIVQSLELFSSYARIYNAKFVHNFENNFFMPRQRNPSLRQVNSIFKTDLEANRLLRLSVELTGR